jgi:hypothetical protein
MIHHFMTGGSISGAGRFPAIKKPAWREPAED